MGDNMNAEPLEDTEYDVIVVGTGLCESMVAGALAVAGQKVLHLDHRSYYGGSSATLDLRSFTELASSGREHGAVPSFSSWVAIKPGRAPAEPQVGSVTEDGAQPQCTAEEGGEQAE